MKKTELVQIMTILGSNYQSIGKQLEDEDKRKIVLRTWFECLEDLDFNLVLAAVKKNIISSSYPPTIHDIRKAALDLITPEEEKKSAIDYWSEAFKMIKNGTYMTEEEFEKHSPVVKRFFGNVAQVKELAMTDYQTVSTVTKGQFLKQIEVIQAREKENNLLPDSIKQVMLGITNNKLLE
ncbi:replicative helicase loader/inhibitor [Clostridium nigeriense]|uniref:replicative helicase loader/inhibitor n=1 Tax=Clostridium nigeriense TaxID=1805470 RepID=UPI003D34DDE2